MDIDVFEQRLDRLDKDALATFIIRRQHQFSPEEKEVVQRILAAKLPPDAWRNHVDKLRRDGVDLTPLNKPQAAVKNKATGNPTMVLILVISLVLGLGALVYASLLK